MSMIVTTVQCLICDEVWEGEAAWIGEGEESEMVAAGDQVCPTCGCTEVSLI